VISYYSACASCEFTFYEGLVLGATVEMIGVLLLGIYLVLMQKTQMLRVVSGENSSPYLFYIYVYFAVYYDHVFIHLAANVTDNCADPTLSHCP